MSLIRPYSRPRVMKAAVWTVQIALAAFYAMVGLLKLSQPIPALAEMMRWPAAMPEWFVRFVGAAELTGAAGLILPAATGILPRLTDLAAAGLVILQLCAIAFHLTRGEFQVLALNVVLLVVPIFVVWARAKTASVGLDQLSGQSLHTAASDPMRQ